MKRQPLPVVVLSLLSVLTLHARVLHIADYGAVNDGKTLNTQAVQRAIDACTQSGGGTVMVDGGGVYVIGTIYLKSHVTLHIDNGTVLQGSPNFSDYAADTHKIMYKREKHMDRCLIFARDAKCIAIEGYGTIDGNGHRANFNSSGRPMLLRFLNCSQIHMHDVRLINPAAWTSAWLYCHDIDVSGVTADKWPEWLRRFSDY